MNGNVSAERPKQGGDHKISEEARMPKSPFQSKAHNGRARRDGAARSAEVKFSGSEEGQDDAIDLEAPTPRFQSRISKKSMPCLSYLPAIHTCNIFQNYISSYLYEVPFFHESHTCSSYLSQNYVETGYWYVRYAIFTRTCF